MTLEASWRVVDGDVWRTEGLTITTSEQVRQLIVALSRHDTTDARAYLPQRPLLPSGWPDHEIIIGVRGDRGSLLYSDGDIGGWVTLGDGPEDPPVYAEGEFPARCEIPLPELEEALVEMVEAGRRPECVVWQPFEEG
ncbi:Imm1 family immunity protein [Streptoalloteichus hindustanus]|uniref:Immunity protein Imm1 n=1 Tax=Streptoalloteichus hindustanus TaxID=2017 RepID=A0A1M5MHG2_STRHI|nr:Imm1 family immunity protein [Streptoalloteichus hindustanus]SHG76173.1 Immunity protein Imm1 [Streptoalloteichus hindustanus]